MSIRWLLTVALGCSSLLCSTVLAVTQPLLIGTNVAEQGIFASTLDMQTGEFGEVSAVGNAPRPTFLALHPTLPLVYAVTQEQQQPAGGLRAFRIGTSGQKLELVGQQPTGDEGATHLALDSAARQIAVAHYSGGSTALLPLDKVGTVGARADFVKHTGSSIHPTRQQQPHAHGIVFSTSGKFAFVADLGTDEVIVYRVDEGRLQRQSAWQATPGAGPRHVALHPNGRWLYCINEMDSTLTALLVDAKTGAIEERQTISTLPEDYAGNNSTAEVVVHPSGRFVYGSNRGHDSTAVFSIDPQSGWLVLVQIEPTGGGHPRFVGLESSGKFLVTANRDANNLVSFRIDATSGRLTATGHQAKVPQPMCVVFPQITQP